MASGQCKPPVFKRLQTDGFCTPDVFRPESGVEEVGRYLHSIAVRESAWPVVGARTRRKRIGGQARCFARDNLW